MCRESSRTPLTSARGKHHTQTHTFSFSPGPHRRPTALRSTTGPRSKSKLQTTTSFTQRLIAAAVLSSTNGGGRGEGSGLSACVPSLFAGSSSQTSGDCAAVALEADLKSSFVDRSTLGIRTFRECDRVIPLRPVAGALPAPFGGATLLCTEGALRDGTGEGPVEVLLRGPKLGESPMGGSGSAAEAVRCWCALAPRLAVQRFWSNRCGTGEVTSRREGEDGSAGLGRRFWLWPRAA